MPPVRRRYTLRIVIEKLAPPKVRYRLKYLKNITKFCYLLLLGWGVVYVYFKRVKSLYVGVKPTALKLTIMRSTN